MRIGKLKLNWPKWGKKTPAPIKYPFRECYTMPDGVRYMVFTDPARIPSKRYVYAQVALRHAQMAMTRDAAQELTGQAVEYANKGKMTDAIAVMVELHERFKLMAEEESLLAVAAAYIFREDEDPHDYDERLANEKIMAWKANPLAYDFFLQWALNFCKELATIPAEVSLNYLKEVRKTKGHYGVLRSMLKPKAGSGKMTRPTSTSASGVMGR